MRPLRRTLATACLLGTSAAPALGQQGVNPGFDPHRLDFRDLGYPTQNLIPADESRESDRRGKLFIYIPGPGPFEGGLNPTNPVVERMRKGTPGLIPEDL